MKLSTGKFAFLILAALGSLQAAPVSANLAAFSGGATVITFNSIGNNVAITNQFAAQGVTFGSGLYGNTENNSEFNTPGAAVASNFQNSCGCNSVTLTFLNPILRIGMQVVTNDDDNFRITVPGGSLNYTTNINDTFVGLQDLAGFTTVTIQAFGSNNHAFVINDLRFDAAPTGTPEPSTLLSLGAGLALVGMRFRRRK